MEWRASSASPVVEEITIYFFFPYCYIYIFLSCEEERKGLMEGEPSLTCVYQIFVMQRRIVGWEVGVHAMLWE